MQKKSLLRYFLTRFLHGLFQRLAECKQVLRCSLFAQVG
jgi:hypothetical protein